MSTPTQQVIVRNGSGGIGFLGLLTIVLVILKAFEVITIGWIWVFSPLWIPVVVILGLAVVMTVLMLLMLLAKTVAKK